MMFTTHKTRTIVTKWVLVNTLLIAAILMVSFTQARAGTLKYKITSYITKAEEVPITDAEGHSIGMYERKGLAIFGNSEVAAYLSRGTFDIIKGNGSVRGYFQLIFKDGSIIMAKYHGTLTLAAGEKLPSIKGKGIYTKGTGRYEGIMGNISLNGRIITPYAKQTKGDMYVEVTSTLFLPSK